MKQITASTSQIIEAWTELWLWYYVKCFAQICILFLHDHAVSLISASLLNTKEDVGKINFFQRQWIPGLKVFKEFIFSKEQGLDADPHIHAFIRTREKMLFNKLRLFLRRFKVEGKCILRDLKPCKSAKSYMRYITKEDYNAVVFKLGRRGRGSL